MLEVELQDGCVYRYSAVPLSVYRQLVEAQSKGAFFNAEIARAYTFTKISDPESSGVRLELQVSGTERHSRVVCPKKSPTE